MSSEFPIGSIVRVGLPLVILVFYVTAAVSIDYTADGTYTTLQFLRGSGPSPSATPAPLWLGLLKAGTLTGLDDVMVAKILSLVFGCAAVMMAFLLGFEVTGDRLLALLTALGTALSSMLLRETPSGGAWTLMLCIVTATVFLLQRNEYLLASVLSACCLLLAWASAVLLGIVLFDLMVNSIHRRRAAKMAGALLLTVAGVLLPWFLTAKFFGLGMLPSSPPADLSADPFTAAALALLVAVGGIAFLIPPAVGGWHRLRENGAAVALIVFLLSAGITFSQAYLLIAFPLCLAYALRGVRVMGSPVTGEKGVYLWSLILTGCVLLLNQLSYSMVAKPEMNRVIEESSTYAQVGGWLKRHAPEHATIAAEYPGIVGYYADRTITPLSGDKNADFVIARICPDREYDRRFVPQGNDPLLVLKGEPLVVWARNDSTTSINN